MDQVPSEYAAKDEDVIGLRGEEEPYEGLVVSLNFPSTTATRRQHLTSPFLSVSLPGCYQDDPERRGMGDTLHGLDRYARWVDARRRSLSSTSNEEGELDISVLFLRTYLVIFSAAYQSTEIPGSSLER